MNSAPCLSRSLLASSSNLLVGIRSRPDRKVNHDRMQRIDTTKATYRFLWDSGPVQANISGAVDKQKISFKNVEEGHVIRLGNTKLVFSKVITYRSRSMDLKLSNHRNTTMELRRALRSIPSITEQSIVMVTISSHVICSRFPEHIRA